MTPTGTLKTRWVLKDARFISIVKLLCKKDMFLAIYLVRLITGFGMVPSKRYIEKIDIFLNNSTNRTHQYRELT